ncbi:MAG: hypothetical protein J5595_04140, partial [Bacteroidales bacterium]|nr:hypothetical protein [Bacteroidales bacterium]
DNSAFDGGNDFVDSAHNFSYDLDIFGRNSIFQMVNRTCTTGGKKMLAQRFINPIVNINKIKQIQEDSAMFADELELRQQFRAFGTLYASDSDAIPDFGGVKYHFTGSMLWWIVSLALMTATCAAIVLACMDVCSPYVGLLLYFVQLAVIGANAQKTNDLYKLLNNGSKTFRKYEKLFETIEKFPHQPAKFSNFGGGYVSGALKELAQIAAFYEQRANLMVMIFGQGILCYDIHINIKFEKWLRRHAAEVPEWFEMAHEYDCLLSLANLKYNHPEWSVPQPVEGSFILNAVQAGHPLINPEKMVCNDINFSDCPFLTILTGANMAGKSTYLRTIGVNLVLAQIGAVVCAKEFVFSPTEIMTSIRTTDSVQDSESYFFAELKRLQKIVNRLQQGATLFIIVDEMLRGTNSKDKHDGSQQFIQKLLKYNCYGIFATHDIDIGNLRDQYPQNVNAKCFEISFEGDSLIFDYKLKDGISQNLNASYLMRKMGIIE